MNFSSFGNYEAYLFSAFSDDLKEATGESPYELETAINKIFESVNSEVESAVDFINPASMGVEPNLWRNHLAMRNEQTGTVLIDSNVAAAVHYFFGGGEDGELSRSDKLMLRTHERQKLAENRLTKGITARNGNYRVQMESYVYHIGDTAVAYQTQCSLGRCKTKFTAFVAKNPDGSFGPDGIRDIFSGDDRKGPAGEFGTPYDYRPYSWEIEYEENFEYPKRKERRR